jgi:16S rRNA (adenine1518-N6/adenine1519-N6)-dimethyltransferase
LYRLYEYRHLLKEGVIMLQEEVAQKLTKKRGKGFGASSLFFQYYFSLKLLNKIPPNAFNPPPKIYSRLLYFAPRFHQKQIAHENLFWEFIKICFSQPRRMLANNVRQSSLYRDLVIPEQFTNLRAQQLNMDDFLTWWDAIVLQKKF